jgi:hypothetical protein
MQVGEAQGHRMEADIKTLQMAADLGNSSPKGIRGRLGHPGVSENTTGRQVQVASNFVIQGNKLLHTSRLLETARRSPVFSQDPVEWILDVAEKNPSELGESVIIDTQAVWTLSDGTEIDAFSDDEGSRVKRPETALTKYPVMRPVKLYFVDFVNEGALTPDGLFSKESQFYQSGSSKYAEQIFSVVDEWSQKYQIGIDQIPGKVTQMLEAYLDSRRRKRMNGTDEADVDGTETSSETHQAQENPQAAQATQSLEIADRIIASLTQETKADAVASASRLEALEAQVALLGKTVKRQADALQAMFDRLQLMSGEPVGRDRVSRQPMQTFAPPVELSSQAPVHTSERNQHSSPRVVDPLVAVGQRQVARNQRYSGQGG